MDKISKNSLNAICPYFTMFPVEFPYVILKSCASDDDWVIDPFCGRGTTNYACRMLGLPSIGVDSSPVAVAISKAKLANTTPTAIEQVAKRILNSIQEPQIVPTGEFWWWAFHSEVLHTLCRLREGLLTDCRSESRVALRAIILGALHGPKNVLTPSYFSNQCQRTYAPKPRYAVNYWKQNDLRPEAVDIIRIIKNRASRYYGREKTARGRIIKSDSREPGLESKLDYKIRWVITSPPYYGMRTYLPDQWLRLWFLGGQPSVDYSMRGQIEHSSPEQFSTELECVWRNMESICSPEAMMIVRFGGINDRQADPLSIIRQSFQNTSWKVDEEVSAGFATQGKRQANHIRKSIKAPREEYDIWVKRC